MNKPADDLPFVVRPAIPADACGIAKVQVAAWRLRLSQWTPDWFIGRFDEGRQTEKYAARIADPTNHIVVAEIDELVCGIAGAKPHTTAPSGYDQFIFGIYVAPDHERRGIGTAMMRDLLCSLHRARYDTAIVFTFTDNLPARRLYEKVGGSLTEHTDTDALEDLKIPHVSYRFELSKLHCD